VITGAPERLARHCPRAVPVPAAGLYQWFDARWAGGPYSSLLPGAVLERLRASARLAERAGPRAARAALRAELLAREPVTEEARRFLAALLGADALVVSGRGGTADAFRDDGLRLLEVLRTANALGATTAMVGQGLGPAEDPALRARAAEVLPSLDLIAVRDRVGSVPLLESLGVAPERVVVTGDDALASAHTTRPDGPRATGLGVGVRVADYSGLGDAALEAVGHALSDAAERHGTDLRGIPISLYPHESDAGVLDTLTGDGGSDVETPASAIERAGACRAIVTGSYHAAVFGLAQGVPVVGLSSSAYYGSKLEGVADLFPAGGCTVVSLAEADVERRIADTIDAAWAASEGLRPELIAAAERQIAAGEAAYARLAESIAGPSAGSQSTSNGSTSGSATWRDEPTLSAAN